MIWKLEWLTVWSAVPSICIGWMWKSYSIMHSWFGESLSGNPIAIQVKLKTEILLPEGSPTRNHLFHSRNCPTEAEDFSLGSSLPSVSFSRTVGVKVQTRLFYFLVFLLWFTLDKPLLKIIIRMNKHFHIFV